MADLIITDDNWQDVCTLDERCGTQPRDFARVPYGSLPFAGPYDGEAIPVIPMEQWPDRIADLARAGATLKDVWQESGIGVWNQGSLPYCHAFSAVMTAAITRALQGLPFVRLSASSVGGPVTGFRAKGAFIHDDLEQMVTTGVSTLDFVPMATWQASQFKDGWQDNAAKHKVSEFIDVEPRNLLVHGSLLLSGYAVGVGLNYWGHAVTDLVLRDLQPGLPATNPDRYGIEFLNSWGTNWGNEGWGVRTGKKRLADAIYAVRQLVI